MRLNESVAIIGERIVLVPYRKEHVPQYHQWMTDPAIREATASEALSLEQEYAMQKSWHTDDDKLTFIILKRHNTESPAWPPVARLTDDMIGDVNLFLHNNNSQPDEGKSDFISSADSHPLIDAELEIMIAEPSARRKGYALEALRTMMAYAGRPPLSIKPESFLVRIGKENTQSISMFTKLGFSTVKEVAVFQEVEMRITSATSMSKVADLATLDLATMSC